MQDFDTKLNIIESLKFKKLTTLELADEIRKLQIFVDFGKAEQNIIQKEIIKMLTYKIRRPFTAFRKQIILDNSICTTSATHLRFALSFLSADDTIVSLLDDHFKNSLALALDAIKAVDPTEFNKTDKPCPTIARIPITCLSDNLSIPELLEFFEAAVISHSTIII